MNPLRIRPGCPRDHAAIAEIYNSDPRFLLHHLGVDSVTEAWVAQEASCMDRLGFSSCVITREDSRELLGVLDYRPGKEVYLSLLMLPSHLRGQGLGRSVYTLFEAQMTRLGAASVRIDVVNDYPGHPLPFWLRLGFSRGESIELEWGQKKSSALIMRKSLRSPLFPNTDLQTQSSSP